MNSVPDSAQPQTAGDIGAGHVLGRYELLVPIASGGMAMVWAARLKGTRGFQKIVAVKTMLPKLSEDEQFEQMFLDEASLASRIHHPHVVEIMDLGEQDGVLYLVMEWIDGVPLNHLMKAAKKEGGIPAPIAARIVMQAAAGLHAAHELKNEKNELVGLVHRDVSPQNILVTYDGVAKVVDFGVAKATAMGDGATQAGQIKGKIGYMAPEQVKGEALDRRVDVFALGIVLYALTTGKHPFRRESEAATMYNICAPQPVIPPRKIKADFPQKLEEALLTALEKDPAKRFQTANDFLKALDRALPTELRTTDEDVAAYVARLFGDRREEQRRALAQALERADQAAISQTSVRSLMREAVPIQMPISQVSLAGTGPTSTSFPDGELSSAHLNVSTTGSEATGKSRRGLFFAAAIVIVLAVAVVVTASVRSNRTAASPTAPATTAKVAAASKPATEPAAPQTSAQNIEDIPTEPTAVAVSKSDLEAAGVATPTAGRGKAAAPRPSKGQSKPDPAPAASAPAAPAKTSKSKVQFQDPGF